MSLVLDAIHGPDTTEKVRQVAAGLTSVQPNARWCDDLSSSKYFPFRYHATALHGSGPEADEILVISIECLAMQDENGERLVVSADIMGEGGVLLVESPKIEIDIPPEAEVLSNPEQVIGAVKTRLEAAIEQLAHWIDDQRVTIAHALASA